MPPNLTGCEISRTHRGLWVSKHALERLSRSYLPCRHSGSRMSENTRLKSPQAYLRLGKITGSVLPCVLRKSSVRVYTRKKYAQICLRKRTLEDPWYSYVTHLVLHRQLQPILTRSHEGGSWSPLHFLGQLRASKNCVRQQDGTYNYTVR